MDAENRVPEMTSEDVMRIACRAVAVYLLASLLWWVVQRAVWLFTGDGWREALAGAILSLLVSIAVLSVMPILVWRLAPTLARLSERRLVRVRLPSDLTRDDVMLLAIATIGVVFLALGVVDLLDAFGDFLSLRLLKIDGADPIAIRSLLQNVMPAVGRCIVGIGLMMGPQAVMGLVGRLRRFGLESGSQTPRE